VKVQVNVSYLGMVNTVSSLFSWLSGGFLDQFKRLPAWASPKHGGDLAGTLLRGDFNIEAESDGYQAVVRTQKYEDQYLAATSRNVFDKVFRHPSPDR
jgi:endonuclease/exonuclease/phosphatase family metal-dependent hydrolase